MKKNFLLFSFIATLIASPAYSVTVTKTYVDASDKTLQKNMVLLRDMLNTKDADGNWITLDTDEQLAIPAINELHTEMAGKQDLISAENPLAAENVSGLADVAKTGSYNDLSDVPTIPSIEGLVTDADFQDALATKQSKLTPGAGITIDETTADDGTVTATISANVNLEDVVGEIIDAQGNAITVQQALDSKADASALDEYAKSADVADTYATKDSLSGYATTAALADKEDTANKLVAATAEEIEAMSSEERATKFPSVAVAQTIASAAVAEVNEVAGDLSTLQTQVGTNTADIAEIKEAGYQTSSDVQGAITTATANLATKSELAAKADTDDLGTLAYKNTIATSEIDVGAVTLDKIAGIVPAENKTMLMSVDASGNVTWMSVEILK